MKRNWVPILTAFVLVASSAAGAQEKAPGLPDPFRLLAPKDFVARRASSNNPDPRSNDDSQRPILFEAEGPGSRLDVPFDVPEDGDYEVYTQLAQGPDYGTYTVLLDGKPPPAPQLEHEPGADVRPQTQIDGYAVETYVGADYQVGWPRLAKGRHTLSYVCLGRNAASTGYNLGVDNIVLAKTGAAAAAVREPRRPAGSVADLGQALSDPDPVTRGLAAIELRGRGRARSPLSTPSSRRCGTGRQRASHVGQRHRRDRSRRGAGRPRPRRGLLGQGRAGPRPPRLRHGPRGDRPGGRPGAPGPAGDREAAPGAVGRGGGHPQHRGRGIEPCASACRATPTRGRSACPATFRSVPSPPSTSSIARPPPA